MLLRFAKPVKKRSRAQEEIRIALDLAEREIRVSFLKALALTRADLTNVTQAVVDAGNWNAAQAMIPAETSWSEIGEKLLWDELPLILRDTLEKSGNIEAVAVDRAIPRFTLTVVGEKLAIKGRRKITGVLKFDVTNPAAVDYVRRSSAKLIGNITNDVRAGIRIVIEEAFLEGIPVAATARRISSLLGVSPREAGIVSRLRERLLRDGLSAVAVAEKIQAQADKLVSNRAETIARTEIVAASAKGQSELWNQAAEEGLIDRGVAVKEWIVSEDDRLCPICEPLDGLTVPVDSTFPGGEGQPPAHPNCRCSMGLWPVGRDR